MPVASALEKMLGAPALLLPMGQSSDNCHLANERIRRVNLLHGKNVVKHLLQVREQLGLAEVVWGWRVRSGCRQSCRGCGGGLHLCGVAPTLVLLDCCRSLARRRAAAARE